MSPMTLYRRRKEAGLVKTIEPAPFDELFFDSWDDGMAWLLGLLWTDGCIYGNTVEICSKDLQLIELVMAIIGGRFGLKNDGAHARVTFTSRRTAERLRSLGLHERKSLTVQWPVGMPAEHAASFIRGALDGDGSVLLRKNRVGQQVPDLSVQLVSASPRFANACGDWFKSVGVNASTYVRIPNNEKWAPFWKLVIYRQECLRRLHSMLYPNKDVPCLHRKRVTFDTWIEKPRARTGRPARP